MDKLVIEWDAYILSEWEKNLKAFQEINARLVGKDKRILKLLNNANTLMKKVSGLNFQLKKVELIVPESYWLDFNEVVKQAQHFFANNKDLDYTFLDSSKFLEVILCKLTGMVHP